MLLDSHFIINKSLKKQGQCTDNFQCLLHHKKVVDFGGLFIFTCFATNSKTCSMLQCPSKYSTFLNRQKILKTSNKNHNSSTIPMSPPSDHFLLVPTSTSY